MQETKYYDLEQEKRLMEFFKAPTDMEVIKKMDNRLEELKPFGHTLVRRVPKIGRNAPCPCGSGRKFKKCCIDKVQ